MDGSGEESAAERDGNRNRHERGVSRQIDPQNLTRAVTLAQQRFEFSISPPTIPRSNPTDTANIFSNVGASNAALHSDPTSWASHVAGTSSWSQYQQSHTATTSRRHTRDDSASSVETVATSNTGATTISSASGHHPFLSSSSAFSSSRVLGIRGVNIGGSDSLYHAGAAGQIPAFDPAGTTPYSDRLAQDHQPRMTSSLASSSFEQQVPLQHLRPETPSFIPHHISAGELQGGGNTHATVPRSSAPRHIAPLLQRPVYRLDQHFFTPLPAEEGGRLSRALRSEDTTEEDSKVSSYYCMPISPQDVVTHQQTTMTMPISFPGATLGAAIGGVEDSRTTTPSRYFSTPVSSISRTFSRPASTATVESMGSIDESESSVDFGHDRSLSRLSRSASSEMMMCEFIRPASGGSRKSKPKRKSQASPATTSTPRSAVTSSRGASDEEEPSPPPQNLRGDPFRSAKVKTELCRNWNTPRGCQFGDKCNYAHGVHELKFTKLMDLERAGLVDIEIFRTHPCITWVSTGACPFDQRCIGIHDPRVAGSPEDSAWLPHAETMINKVDEDGANVDKFYHERLSSAYNSCPLYGFVPLVKQDPGTDIKDDANWQEFFAFVCNFWRLERMHEFQSKVGIQKEPIPRVLDHLSEANTLEIVLKMREKKLGTSYAYSPTHLLHGELCMVLQTKRFQLQSILGQNNLRTVCLKEITDSKEERVPDHGFAEFSAHEVAFGPVGDPTVRPMAVFFDIPPGELVKCTPQQAKHHKRSRHRLKSAKRSQQKGEEASVTIIPPFNHYQPRDEATFDLITRVLLLRMREVQLLSRGFDPNVARTENQHLDNEMESLKQMYFSLLQFWVTLAWPEQILEEPINNNTDVPPVEGEYDCNVHEVKCSRTNCSYGLGSLRHNVQMTPMVKYFPSFLWKSYLINTQIIRGIPIETVKHNTCTADDDKYFQLCRLEIFRHLSLGRNACRARIPLFFHENTTTTPDISSINDLIESWESVRNHYENNQHSIASRMRQSSPGDGPTRSVYSDEVRLSVEEQDLATHLERCAKDTTRSL